ncbi:ribosome silencing factor [Nitrospirales bacterium NOB]|nr:ribosome silencing factor [Nitrospira sp. NTP2]MDL1890534.1 ribosome silencing factor [Nitrospirales bacterium NOB]QOJ37125.1 MAG: ribosome silencing factor [Nitrospira sp.]RIK59251.1 MAG: ribosome silencing factor [Nitrospira sp.]
MALEAKAKALAIASAILDKKATDVLILHIAKLTSVADYLVIGSGESERQARAIADHVSDLLTEQGEAPLSVEGASRAQWIVMDFGDVVVHVFQKDIREHYALERLWGDAGQVRLPEERVVKPPRARRTATRPARTRKRV